MLYKCCHTKYIRPHQKLKGGALIYTVLILLVLGILLGMFLMRFRLHSELNQRLEANMQASDNVLSAVNYFLAVDADKKGFAKGVLFGSKADSFYVQTMEWGIYRLLHTKAKHGIAQDEKICLVGMKPTENLQAAIFLNDNNKPLKIVGKTKIAGTVYLPQSGLQVGNIGNRTFEGDSLIRGKIKKSKSETLNVSYKNIAANFSELIALASSSATQNKGNTAPFYIQNYIYNSGMRITGKIAPYSRITSSQYLEISKETNANLCVFYAPYIRIKSGFKGNIQVFATDSVIVEEGVTLDYPSAIVLSGITESAKGYLKIHANSQIEGAVINDTHILQKINTTDNYTFIDFNSRISGHIITNGKLELKGKVGGFVAVNEFQVVTPAAVYINHLLDAEIDYRKLSPLFTTGTYVANNPNYQVITWLR